ncbi:hypothetical protein LCGC14_0468790 [marine sediment metagenome]|uniref:Uncharacterized protein n=1 Tax=marine sediment metagenome TaxID=412755 RepID=A0A0F9VLM0_9ZZZZ
MTLLETIEQIIDDLQAIDYGYLGAAEPEEHEVGLTFLEAIADELEELDLWFPETDLAIQYFLTDPQRSRTYLYGPTDVQDGVGLIELLKRLADELEAEEYRP